MDCGTQLAYSYQLVDDFKDSDRQTRSHIHADLVFGVPPGFILCMQDYKSLCATVMICATLVNIQAHTHVYRQH